ncbi:hypothetical protein SBA2_680036 [Acidobacteriia bacterium SbA2]|nr:hypothetical protein SBA2_680036 [Acidobacteriia bacterium SbA2]
MFVLQPRRPTGGLNIFREENP